MQLNIGMWNGTQLIGSLLAGNLSIFDGNGSEAWNYSVLEDIHSDVFQQLHFRIPVILAYTFVFLCCVFGNLLVMLVVILHRRMRTATNFFLANLALADFCVGIFCVYQNLMLYLTNSWTLGDFLCRVYQFIHGLSYTASVLFLAIISLERYVVIVHPMWGKRFITICRLRIALVILWLVSGIYNSPRFILYATTKVPSWHKENDYYTLCVLRRGMYKTAHFDLFNFGFQFVFPITVMGILYTKIAIKLWRSQKLHGQKVNIFSCCFGERNSKINTKATSDVFPKKMSIKEVPAECPSEEPEDTVIPLHEDGSVAVHDNTTTMHEDIYAPSKTDFESSGAEEEEGEGENDNDDEDLLENFNKTSIKSFFSRRNAIRRYSFSCSDNIQQQRASFKSLKAVACKIKSEELKSLPEVTSSELECLNKSLNEKTEFIFKNDLQRNDNEKDSELGDRITLSGEIDEQNDSKNKIKIVEVENSGEIIPDDFLAPLTETPRRLNSLRSHSRGLSPKEKLSHTRRCSEPPAYIGSRAATRRASEPITYIKSLLQRSQSEDSPALKSNRRIRRTGSKILRSRRKIIRFLIVILCAFVICNLPHHARKLWQDWSSSYDGNSNVSLFITLSTTLFFYMNSGINPFLYAFLSANFRKCVIDVLLFKTHVWTRRVRSPKNSNNSKRTAASSSSGTSASRGSASSTVRKV